MQVRRWHCRCVRMAGEGATSLLAQFIASAEEPSGDIEGKSFPSYPYNKWHPALLRSHPLPANLGSSAQGGLGTSPEKAMGML